MSIGLRIMFAVLTLVTDLALLIGGIACFFVKTNSGGNMYPVALICLMLAGLFGFFVFHDYRFFFGTKTAPTPPTNEAPKS